MILGYGHIGDGNLHINICVKRDSEALHKQVIDEKEIFEYVIKLGGSMSAEHGMGIQKTHFLALQKSEEVIEVFKEIKRVFDPKGIMNPYKVLP